MYIIQLESNNIKGQSNPLNRIRSILGIIARFNKKFKLKVVREYLINGVDHIK